MIYLRDQVLPYDVWLAREFVASVPADELDWPSHRHAPEVMRLLASLPSLGGELCEPQLVRQPPHTGGEVEVTFHADDPPPWADGRGYLVVMGVALTEQTPENGGLLTPHAPGRFMVPGDVVLFGPDELHSLGVNRTAVDRMATYFRFLETPSHGQMQVLE